MGVVRAATAPAGVVMAAAADTDRAKAAWWAAGVEAAAEAEAERMHILDGHQHTTQGTSAPGAR